MHHREIDRGDPDEGGGIEIGKHGLAAGRHDEGRPELGVEQLLGAQALTGLVLDEGGRVCPPKGEGRAPRIGARVLVAEQFLTLRRRAIIT